MFRNFYKCVEFHQAFTFIDTVLPCFLILPLLIALRLSVVVFRDYIIYLLHRVGSMRCMKNMPGCSSGCADGGSFDGTPKTSPVTTPDDQKKCNVTVMHCAAIY